MSSYNLGRCFGFVLKMMSCFVLATLVLWREGVHMQSVGGGANAYRRLFLWLGQYWTTGTCPSTVRIFCDFFNCRFLLMFIFNSTVKSLHRPGSVDA